MTGRWKSNGIGLWKTREAWCRSKHISKNDVMSLPGDFKILLRYNKFRDGDETRPHFVFFFADSHTADAICLKTNDYKDFRDNAMDFIRHIGEVSDSGLITLGDPRDYVREIYYACENFIKEYEGDD